MSGFLGGLFCGDETGITWMKNRTDDDLDGYLAFNLDMFQLRRELDIRSVKDESFGQSLGKTSASIAINRVVFSLTYMMYETSLSSKKLSNEARRSGISVFPE